jgi:hypothetical protein
VGIERLDEHDAPAAREHSADNPVGDQPAVDLPAVAPETRDRATFRAEYHATVDAEYRAAHESWDAASPELRRTWEAHEARWPALERSGQPLQPDTPSAPGAWRGDGDRYLDPEANAEVDRGCDRIREAGENVIVPGMRAIEAEDPDRHLIGLEYHLKGPERLKEKIARALEEQPELTPRQALAGVPDAVRFTFCYSDEHYTPGVCADLDRLSACGFELAKPLKNSWPSDQYKGINTQWREPGTGQLFEVQFHTRASFEAKQLSHAAYERIRNPQTPDAELDELKDFQRQISAKIPVPPGALEIDYKPRKERDG